MHLRGDRFRITLIFTIESFGAVRAQARRGEIFESHLSNRHFVIELDRNSSGIEKLERHPETIPRIEKSGRRMDDETESTERTLSLETSDELVRYSSLLDKHPKCEFPRMENECFVIFDFNFLHEIFRRHLRINHEILIHVEYEKRTPEVHIITRWLYTFFLEWLDNNFSRLQFFQNIPIR